MEQVRASYSIYSKKLSGKIGGRSFDLSNLVPKKVWEICKSGYPNPMEDWKIRKKLQKILLKYFRETIDNFDENYQLIC